MKIFSSTQKSYLAGFLDGDGSIYVRLKPNPTYKYGFQIAPYIVFFQSNKDRRNFEKLCAICGLGYMRERKDGILEYIVSKKDAIRILLKAVKPYVILKSGQVNLMLNILDKKERIKNKHDFMALANMVDMFRKLNYSKKRKIRTLTP
jgi:hypothetical protein